MPLIFGCWSMLVQNRTSKNMARQRDRHLYILKCHASHFGSNRFSFMVPTGVLPEPLREKLLSPRKAQGVTTGMTQA